MKTEKLLIDKLETERLILMPYTIDICKNILNNDFRDVCRLGLNKGKRWPDDDVLETLPKIINNLLLVEAPTGFESWMIIKKGTQEIIGDIGFKGFNYQAENIDLGYGIIKEERRKGYAEEAAKMIIEWAFSNKNIKKITANCSIENNSSINLLQKLNFVKLNEADKMIYWSLQDNNHSSKS